MDSAKSDTSGPEGRTELGLLAPEVNGQTVKAIEDFVKAIEDIPDRQYFPVLWYDMREFRDIDALGRRNKDCSPSSLSHWCMLVQNFLLNVACPVSQAVNLADPNTSNTPTCT